MRRRAKLILISAGTVLTGAVATVVLRPPSLQQQVDRAQPGSTIKLEAKEYSGNLRVRRKSLTLEGVPGKTVFRGGAEGIRAMPGATDLTLVGITSEDATAYAFRADPQAHGFTLRACTSIRAGRSGVLTARCDRVTVEGGTFRDSRKEHGIYLSEGGTGHKLLGNTCTGNAKSGIQVNGEPRRIKGVEIRKNTCNGNASGGIVLMAVTKATLAGNDVSGNKQSGISVWDLGQKRYRCEDIDLTGQDTGPLQVATSTIGVKR
jgi:parallel beta-helix repeat protein